MLEVANAISRAALRRGFTRRSFINSNWRRMPPPTQTCAKMRALRSAHHARLDKKPEDAERALLAEIKRFQDAPVTKAELDKAKNLLVTNELREREKNNG